MTDVSASAPGKVVLCGEYAVLHGAPAICMAVNRRAKVEVTDFEGDWHRVSAPGFSSLEGRFIVDGAAVDWLQGEAEYRIVDSVWRSVISRALGRAESRHLSITLDTRAFIDEASGKKIGIGSSAALTVALTAALGQTTDVFSSAMRAHRLFQHGAGSGVDIATSSSGGLVDYHMNDAPAATLRWPTGLTYRLIWTGVPASTRMMLDKFEKAGRRSPRTTLVNAAERMAEAWHSASAVMSQYPVYIEALRQFSVDHDLGIFDAGHDKLVREAAAAGLVYKPCGAGGGDVGILLGTSDRHLDDFMTGKDESRCQVLACELDPDGVLLEQR